MIIIIQSPCRSVHTQYPVHCMQSAKPSAKESILCVYVFSTCIITTFVGKLNSSNDILHVKEIRQTLHGQCCGKGVQNTHTPSKMHN